MNVAELGKIIRKERIRRGLSCRELGDMSGTSAATICRIENGKRANAAAKSFFKICKALEIKIDDAELRKPEPAIVDPCCFVSRLNSEIMITRGMDLYSVGFRNGLRYALYLLNGQMPKYEQMEVNT